MEKNGIGKKVSLSLSKNDDIPWFSAALEGGPGFCAFLLTIASGLLILATLPLSLFFSIKVSSSFCLSLYNLPQNSSSKEGGSLSVSSHCLPLPLSWQVVQEYERAVIFRLGRLLSGAAKGPVSKDTRKKYEKCFCWFLIFLWSLKIFHFQGIFFIIPCVDSYTKVRVHLESVPVKWEKSSFAKHRILLFLFFAGGYEGAHIRCSSTRGQISFSFSKKRKLSISFLLNSDLWQLVIL